MGHPADEGRLRWARVDEDAARRARDGGAGLLVVTAAPHAEAFYERCGFRTVGEAPTRFGPAVRTGT